MMRDLIIVALCVVVSFSATAAEFTGKVVDVLDGDTIVVLAAGKTVKVRLVDIDAPEIEHGRKPAQPYGHESLNKLKSMLANAQVVRIDYKTTDRYGRILGTVYSGSNDLNAAMVSTGHAWVYKEYSSGQRERDLLALEKRARDNHRGIWSLPVSQQVYPEQWRKAKVAEAPDADDQSIAPTEESAFAMAPECGTKHRCDQMTSCEEARAFMSQCKNMKHLDSNGDGRPCESLCRK